MQTTETWITHLRRWSPVTALSLESARFDTQLLENPELLSIDVIMVIWHNTGVTNLPLKSSYGFRYHSDLIGGSLMVFESRIIADLMLSDVDRAAWKTAIHDENRLQKARPATATRVARAVRQRLERLEAPFWQALRDGDDQLATQVAFCAALARNPLLVEFLEVVVTDAFVTRAEILELYHWDDFLDERVYRDASIADWTSASKRKMRQVAFRMLAEVGLLESTRSRRLRPLFLRPELVGLLERHRFTRLLNCLKALGPR
ncbi:RRXRR protein [Ectothiorhodospira magna]|uniref:RRXRR protein n=1 Tax=Ectothiorhodospira magna TaxID=867345 RepID=A0A1H9E7I3_9GAMM|nr:RRXRR protein [Ectothiorhodospira magna]